MKHLEERVSDLVDERLDHDERDRALAHLTVCEHCRTQVELERYAKATLHGLPEAEPSARLLASLLSLAEPGDPMPPQRPAFSTPPAPVAQWRHHHDHPAGLPASARPHAESRRRQHARRGVRYAAAGMLSAGALTVLLASLGSPTDPDQGQAPASVVPPVDEFTLEHARTTGTLPFAEPAAILVPAGTPLGDGR